MAQELIDFDREWARMFSDRPRGAQPVATPSHTVVGPAEGGLLPNGPQADAPREDRPRMDESLQDEPLQGGGVDPKEFQAYFERHGRFTAGVETRYPPALLCGAPTYQALATGFPIGMRFHSAPVVRVCDARPMELGHVARADGRWRLYAFGGQGDALQAGSDLHRLCRFLAGSPASPVRRYTRAGEDPDAVFDLRVIVQITHHDVDVHASGLSILLPAKGRYGLIDHEKVFSAVGAGAPEDRGEKQTVCPDVVTGAARFPGLPNDRGETIFERRGIDHTRGALVVVRPDQYVAHVLPLAAHDELAAFFDRFMLERP